MRVCVLGMVCVFMCACVGGVWALYECMCACIWVRKAVDVYTQLHIFMYTHVLYYPHTAVSSKHKCFLRDSNTNK